MMSSEKSEMREIRFCQKTAQKIGAQIDAAQKIAILSHRNPDGDTSGSGLALRILLEDRGKWVQNICVDDIPLSFRALPGASYFQKDFSLTEVDLVITVDSAVAAQTGWKEKKPDLFSGNIPLINIDHHISNTFFGTTNLVESNAASTTAVLWKLFDELKWHVRPNAATCLLNGLLTDTGSLQHSNSTPETMRIAAKMLSAGADLEKIRKNVFATTPISTMRLWGEILDRSEMQENGVVVSTVTEDDFRKTKADPKDIAGVVDYLNMVPDAQYSLLITERNGLVKGSFRTQRSDVNVSDIAGFFGGGGHIQAAGFTKKGRLAIEKRFRIIQEKKELS